MRRNNLFFRSLAVVLCLAMLLGFVPGGIFGSVLHAHAVEDTSAKLYLNAEELTALKAYLGDDSKNSYGFSWKSVYESLIRSAETYLKETEISTSMNTGKTYKFPAGDKLLDPNDPSLREGYIEASKKDNGELFDKPYTGFGALLFGALKTRLETLSLAYLLTKDTRYSDLAISYAMKMTEWKAWTDYFWLTKGNTKLEETTPADTEWTADASNAWAVQAIVAVYDMCGDVLNADQKAAIEQAIISKGLLPLYNRSAKISASSTQNAHMMMLGGMLTGLAAVEKNNADAVVTFKAFALERTTYALDSYATSGNTEGHYYTDYGMNYLLPALAHMYRATRDTALVDHELLTDILPYWTVMFAAPGTNTHPNYSDASVSVYMQLPMAIISKIHNDPLANYFLLGVAGGLSDFQKLVYLNVKPESREPSDYAAVVNPMGYGALRTGFAAGDMLLTLKANNSQMGHNHYDQNAILLNVGGNWLIGDPGVGSYYYEDRDFFLSAGHSTILVDGAGQTKLGDGSTAGVFNKGLYSYIIGSAAGAYDVPVKNSDGKVVTDGEGNVVYTPVLNKFDRHAIQVNHGEKAYYIIMDDLAAAADHAYGWQIYTGGKTPFTVDGNKVALTIGKQQLNLNFVGAQLAIGEKTYTYADAIGTTKEAHTLVATSAASKAHQFLTVISAGEAVAVTDYIDDANVLAAMINYSGSKYDYVMFNRAGGSVTAGLLVTDAAQASVLGLVDGVVTEGYAATGATTMTYNGKVLFTAQSALDIVADAEGWNINTAEAQTVTLNVGAYNGMIRVNNSTLATAADGVLTVELSAGENVIEIINVKEEEIPVHDHISDFENGDFADDSAWNGLTGGAAIADGALNVNVTNAGATVSQAFAAYKRELIDVTFRYNYVSGDAPYVALYFYKDSVNKGNLVGIAKQELGTTAGWQDAAFSAFVPDGANIVAVTFGANNGATASFQIDDVAVNATPYYISNGDFESGTDGWKLSGAYDNNDGVTPVITHETVDGNGFMKFVVNDKKAHNVYQRYETTSYEKWKVTFKYKLEDTDGTDEKASTGYLGVWFYKDKASNDEDPVTGEYLYYKNAYTIDLKPTDGEWVEATLTAFAPLGANIGDLQFGCHSGNGIILEVDDVVLEKTEVVDTVFVEQFNNKDSVISNGWTASNDFSNYDIALFSGKGRYQDGTSMFLQSHGNLWLRSRSFEVTEGMTYVADFFATKSTNNDYRSDYVHVVYLDENDEVLTTWNYNLAIKSGVWSEQILSSVAPKGAKKAYIEFGLGSGSGDYGIDALIISEKVTSEDAPTTPNLILNSSFEQGKASWAGATTQKCQVVNTDAATGLKSLQLSVENDGAGIKQDIANDGYKTVVLTFKYKWISGDTKPIVGLWFFKDQTTNDKDEAGNYLYYRGASYMNVADQSGEWVEYKIAAMVPADTNIIQIQANYSKGSTGTCLIDDLYLEKDLYVYAEDFQNGAHDGWTASNEFADLAVGFWGGINAAAENKDKGLYVQYANAWAQTPLINVIPGMTYTAEYYAIKANNSATRSDAVEMIFVDAEGKPLTTWLSAMDIVSGSWTKQTTSGVAPEKAVGMYLKYSLGAAAGTYAIDNLTIRETETKPGAATNPNLLVDGSFEMNGLRWNGIKGNNQILDENGSKVLKIAVTNAATTISQNVYSVNENETLVLSFKFKWISGDSKPFMGLWFYKDKFSDDQDENENYLYHINAFATYPADQSGEWVEYKLPVTVPAGANLVNFQLGYHSGKTGEVMFDDIVLERTNVKLGENFEDAAAAKSEWTTSNAWVSTPVGIYGTGNGFESNHVFFQTGKTWMESPRFHVIPGMTYVAEFDAMRSYNSDDASNLAEIIFVDANDEVLSRNSTTLDMIYKVMSKQVLAGVAPEGAAQAYLKFSLGNTTGQYAVDNITVTETDEAPEDVVIPEPSAPTEAPDVGDNMLTNGDFENGRNSWTGSYLMNVFDGAAWFNATGKGIQIQQKVAVDAFDVYELTFDYRVFSYTSGTFKAGINFYKTDSVDNGTFVSAEEGWTNLNGIKIIRLSGVTDGWTTATVRVVAPAGSFYAAATFGNDSGTTMSYEIDNVVLKKVADPVFVDYFDWGTINKSGNQDYTAVPNGWTVNHAHNQTNDRADWYPYDGRSLYVQRANCYAASPKFAVSGGESYRISFKYMQNDDQSTANRNGYLAVRYYDAEGNEIKYGAPIWLGDNANQYEWIDMNLDVTAPANAAEARLELFIGATSQSSVFDNIEVNLIENAPAVEDSKVVLSDNFSAGVLSLDGLLYAGKYESAMSWGWTREHGNDQIATNTGWASLYDGEYLILMTKNKSVSSHLFAVEAGKDYVAEYMLTAGTGTGGNGTVAIVFLDENGNALPATYNDLATATSDWTLESYAYRAPEGAVSAYITFKNTSGYFSIDNLVITEHTDANGDHLCDECDKTCSKCIDAVKDHLCDICGEVLSECTDTNDNLKCDWCDKVLVDESPVNGDFEYSDTNLTGWDVTLGSGAVLVNGVGRNDSNALHFNNVIESGLEVWSYRFQIVGGQKTTLSMWVKALEGNKTNKISGWLYFYKEDGTQASTAYASFTVSSAAEDWNEVVATLDVPADAAYAQVRFCSSMSSINNFYFDDISVGHVCVDANKDHVCDNGCDVAVGDHVDTDGDLFCDHGCRKYIGAIFEEYFENVVAYPYTTSGGGTSNNFQPVGWTASEPKNIRVGVYNRTDYVGGTLYDGNYLFLMAKNFWAQSPKFDVTAGNVYTMTFMDHWYNGAADGYAKIVFVNSAGTEIGSETIATGVSETWTRLSLEATAPAGAVQAYIEFGVASDCTGSGLFGVDSVGVFEHAHVDENADCTCDACGEAVHHYDFECSTECSLCDNGAREASHALTHVEAKDPTDCANPGNIEHWLCGFCNEYFADENGQEKINPWYISITVDCVRPEGIADCATVTCETCGNEIYGAGDHDVLICQGGTCSKCNATVEGVGCANYDTPACEDGVCYYCGGFVAGFGHENGAWAPCEEGECSYGCGLKYPASAEHVDEDSDDYCDNCWNHLNHVDANDNNECDVCLAPLGHEHVAGEAVIENMVDSTWSKIGSYDEVIYCAECGEELSRETKAALLNPFNNSPIVLDNSLTIAFNIRKNTLDLSKLTADGYYAIVTRTDANGVAHETKYTADQWVPYTNNRVRIYFNKIAAKEMGDKITVVLYDSNGEQISVAYETSMRELAMNDINTSLNALKTLTDQNTIATYKEQITMFVDMLNYGAAAQKYFGYDEENLVNADLTAEMQAWATQDVDYGDAIDNSAVKGYNNSNMMLESNIVMRLTFFADKFGGLAMDQVVAKITYAHHSAPADVQTETIALQAWKASNGRARWAVVVDWLVIADGDQVVKIELCDLQGNVLATANESLNSILANYSTMAAYQGVELWPAMNKFMASAYARLH